MSTTALTVCMYCDAVHRRIPLAQGASAHCQRCGIELYASRRAPLEIWLALSLASALVFGIAMLTPIVEIQLRGEHTRASLPDALIATWGTGLVPVAVLASLCALLVPMLRIGLQVYVLGHLYLHRRPPGLATSLRLLGATRPWSMIEVFMLGVLVAVVKLGNQATVIPGAGLAAFAVLTALLAVMSGFDADALWRFQPSARRSR